MEITANELVRLINSSETILATEDQPQECHVCGARTEVIFEPTPVEYQIHECLGCKLRFRVDFEKEDK